MIISHHGYNTRTKAGDMALLKLQQPLVFGRFVRPIDVWMTPLPPFRNCTITGWGSTRESKGGWGLDDSGSEELVEAESDLK